MFTPLYQRTKRSATFEKYVYNPYFSGKPLRELSKQYGVGENTASTVKYKLLKEMRCYLIMFKVCRLAEKGDIAIKEKLQISLGLSDEEVSKGSELYSYFYEGGKLPDDWVPVQLELKFKKFEGFERYIEGKDLSLKVENAPQAESVAIFEGEVIEMTKETIGPDIEQSAINVGKQKNQEAELETGIQPEKETEEHTSEMIEDNAEEKIETIEPVIEESEIKPKKRRGRPKGSKNKPKVKDVVVEAETSTDKVAEEATEDLEVETIEEIAEDSKVEEPRRRRGNNVEKSVRKPPNELFASDLAVEKLTRLYDYDLRMKVLRGAVVDNLSKKELMEILGVVDVDQLKAVINDAEIELLGLLLSIKKELRDNSGAKDNGYLVRLNHYLTGKAKSVNVNAVEQLRLVGLLEEDLDCLIDFDDYKRFLKTGKSMQEYAETIDEKKVAVSKRLNRRKDKIAEEMLIAKAVYEAKIAGRDEDAIASELNLSVNQISRYINLYDYAYLGKSANNFMRAEAKKKYLKLFDFVDDGKMHLLNYYLTTKLTMTEIANQQGISIVDLKKELRAGFEKLDETLNVIRSAKLESNQEMLVREKQFLTKLYSYLYEDGERPERPATETELLAKLRAVFKNDSNFDVYYTLVVDKKPLDVLAQELGYTTIATKAKMYKAKRNLDAILYQAEMCIEEIEKVGSLGDKTKSAFGLTDDRAKEIIGLYNYLFNDGELVQFDRIVPLKERAKAVEVKVVEEKPVKGERKNKRGAEHTLDKNAVLKKLCDFYPFDLRYQALKAEVVDGIPFAEIFKGFELSEDELEKVKGDVYAEFENLLTKTIKCGQITFPKPLTKDKAKSLGESEFDVLHYEKLFKYLIKDDDSPRENLFEYRRILQILNKSFAVSFPLNCLNEFYIERQSLEDKFTKSRCQVGRDRASMMEFLKEILSVVESLKEGRTISEIAGTKNISKRVVFELRNLGYQIFVGVERNQQASTDKEVFGRLKPLLKQEDALLLDGYLQNGKTIKEISLSVDVAESDVRKGIAVALNNLYEIYDIAVECNRLLLEGVDKSQIAEKLNITPKKVDYYIELSGYMANGGELPADTEAVTDKQILAALYPIYKNNPHFMIAYEIIVNERSVVSIAKEIGVVPQTIRVRKQRAMNEVENICKQCSVCYEKLKSGVPINHVAGSLGLTLSEAKRRIALYEAIYLNKPLDSAIAESSTSAPVVPKLAGSPKTEVEKPALSTGNNETRNRRRAPKFESVLTYREQCKAKVYKFMKPKVKKFSTVKYYFDGEDIEVVAKRMGLDVYSAIDHILNTSQRLVSDANRRGREEDIPSAFELYCALVPFDQDLFEEPLKAQLRYMGTLPTGALTKLTRSVERVIMSESSEIKNYLISKYADFNARGVAVFDFAEMLSGEDEVVNSLYPKFQKEFTYILDKSRNTWSM